MSVLGGGGAALGRLFPGYALVLCNLARGSGGNLSMSGQTIQQELENYSAIVGELYRMIWGGDGRSDQKEVNSSSENRKNYDWD